MDCVSPFFLLGVILCVPPWGAIGSNGNGFGTGIQVAGLIILIMTIFL